MSSIKFITVSPVKMSTRIIKPKPIIQSYKELLKLDKPKIILEDPDSDLEDENHRAKINEEKEKMRQKIEISKKVKTPKKSVFEEQF